MKRNHSHFTWTVVASLALIITLGCNFIANIAPSATNTASIQAPAKSPPANTPPQATASPIPTLPPIVENTSVPTVEILPTQMDDPIMVDVQDYYSKGYLPYQNGQLTTLPDFSNTQPGAEIHNFTRTKVEAQDFALWADIELNTIGETKYPRYTGCGFAYRVQNNSAGYTAILTNDYVRMGACSSGMYDCELFGTIYGDGKVDAGNKTKVKFSLVVNHDHVAVLVDDFLVGKYALFTTKLLGIGDLYYDAVSNYGAGYWTTCQMTNIKLWESYP